MTERQSALVDVVARINAGLDDLGVLLDGDDHPDLQEVLTAVAGHGPSIVSRLACVLAAVQGHLDESGTPFEEAAGWVEGANSALVDGVGYQGVERALEALRAV